MSYLRSSPRVRRGIIAASLLVVFFGLPAAGILYTPDGRGWRLWGHLPTIKLAPSHSDDGRVQAMLVARVIEVPAYEYPLITLGFHRVTYLTHAEIIGISPASDPELVGLETHGTLKTGGRYLLLLNDKKEVFDGLELESDGRVRLIDLKSYGQNASPDLGGLSYTEPMSVEEAADKLLGQKFPRIPTRFHP